MPSWDISRPRARMLWNVDPARPVCFPAVPQIPAGRRYLIKQLLLARAMRAFLPRSSQLLGKNNNAGNPSGYPVSKYCVDQIFSSSAAHQDMKE